MRPPTSEATAVDQLRLSEVWTGEAVLVRASRARVAADAPFTLGWIAALVRQETRAFRDIGIASLTLSILTILPPLIVMSVVNKVLQFNSVSTLVLLSAVIGVVFIYETLLSHARRLIVNVVGARLDTRLNLHVFSRLLRLPLDYFERHPAGETMYHLAQVYRIREFLTGKLLTTFLDLVTLAVLLPVLFLVNATLAWIVLVCAAVIALIILAFLRPLRRLYERVVDAETWKSAALGETVVGIKTVKALGLEPQRKALWDERVAEAGKARLAFGQLASWPQTLATPVERVMVLGTLLIGAYLAMNDPTGYMVGGLFAFMMLSQRIAQPLVGLARLVARLRGGRCGDQRGGVGPQPTPREQRGRRRPQAAARRRHHFQRSHLHLYRDQDAGARPGKLPRSGREHVRHRREKRIGEIDDRPPSAGYQPRLQRLPQARRG